MTHSIQLTREGPDWAKEFPTVFSKYRFDKTSDHCPWDFTIELRPAALELNEKGYSLCPKEREAMEAWLK
jgi:hypothetical protein